jgi:DNA repair protein RadD
MKPRYYQQEAHDEIMRYIPKTLEPLLLDLATGTGKSIIVSMIAKSVLNKSGKRILCLAPSKELTEQNHQKYIQTTGERASIYSASITKCTSHDVIFGTPKSVLNSIEKFHQDYAAVIIDEAHNLTSTIKEIVEKLRQSNPRLRIIGLSATPYRTGEGYIYEIDHKNNLANKGAYFKRCVYRYTTHQGIEDGFLTPIETIPPALSYDVTKDYKPSMDSAIFDKRAKSAQIVDDWLPQTVDCKGVMVFCATLAQAEFVHQYLEAKGESAVFVSGQIDKADRERNINLYKLQRARIIVNVGVLTTGFDAPHTSAIIIMRCTESRQLLQQIIGRGLRLYENKLYCLLFEYGTNIERHKLEDDLYSPLIKKLEAKEAMPEIPVQCPKCKHSNNFKMRRDLPDLILAQTGKVAEPHQCAGYVDPDGTFEGLQAHTGQRCQGFEFRHGVSIQCDFKYESKPCGACGHENTIAARKCRLCGVELISPEEHLEITHKKIKKDPYTATVDEVQSWKFDLKKSKKGDDMLVVEYKTEFRKVTMYYLDSQAWNFKPFSLATFPNSAPCPSVRMWYKHSAKAQMPKNILVKRKRGTQYFEIKGYNHED